MREALTDGRVTRRLTETLGANGAVTGTTLETNFDAQNRPTQRTVYDANRNVTANTRIAYSSTGRTETDMSGASAREVREYAGDKLRTRTVNTETGRVVTTYADDGTTPRRVETFRGNTLASREERDGTRRTVTNFAADGTTPSRIDTFDGTRQLTREERNGNQRTVTTFDHDGTTPRRVETFEGDIRRRAVVTTATGREELTYDATGQRTTQRDVYRGNILTERTNYTPPRGRSVTTFDPTGQHPVSRQTFDGDRLTTRTTITRAANGQITEEDRGPTGDRVTARRVLDKDGKPISTTAIAYAADGSRTETETRQDQTGPGPHPPVVRRFDARGQPIAGPAAIPTATVGPAIPPAAVASAFRPAAGVTAVAMDGAAAYNALHGALPADQRAAFARQQQAFIAAYDRLRGNPAITGTPEEQNRLRAQYAAAATGHTVDGFTPNPALVTAARGPAVAARPGPPVHDPASVPLAHPAARSFADNSRAVVEAAVRERRGNPAILTRNTELYRRMVGAQTTEASHRTSADALAIAARAPGYARMLEALRRPDGTLPPREQLLDTARLPAEQRAALTAAFRAEGLNPANMDAYMRRNTQRYNPAPAATAPRA